MKKLFSLLGISTIVSSSSLYTSMANLSFTTPIVNANNNDIKNVESSKFVAISAIAPNYYGINSNDSLKYFKQKTQDSFTNSMATIFGNSDDVSKMMDSNSNIKYQSTGDNISNHESSTIQDSIKLFGALNESKLNLQSIINLCSSMDLIKILGKEFLPIFSMLNDNTNMLNRILYNMSLQDAYNSWIKAFGTYDSDGQNDLSQSYFYNRTYAQAINSMSFAFAPNAFINVLNPNDVISEEESSDIFTLLLVLVNFVSQFQVLDNAKNNNLFNTDMSNGDYRQKIMNTKFKSLDYNNLYKLLVLINNSDSNKGIGYKILMSMLFSESTTQKNTDKNHDLIPTYYITHNDQIEEPTKTYGVMPGTTFSSTDPIAKILNNILKSIIHEKYITQQITMDYLMPIHQSIPISFFINPLKIDCNIDLIEYLIGPIFYNFFSQIADNKIISQTIDSLQILLTLLKTKNGNLNMSDVQNDLSSIKKNSNWWLPDKFQMTTRSKKIVAYPIYLPTHVGLGYIFSTGLSNPKWDYNIANTSGFTFDTFWDGTNTNSIIHAFAKTFDDMFALISKLPINLVNQTPENLSIIAIKNKNPILDLLENSNGLIKSWVKINRFIDMNLAATFNKDELIDDAKIFAKDIKNDTVISKIMSARKPEKNSILGYAAALLTSAYNFNENDGITTTQIINDFWTFLGYDKATKQIRTGSFLSSFSHNWDLTESLISSINDTLSSLNADFLPNFDSYYYDWNYNFLNQSGSNYEYTLAKNKNVFYVTLVKDSNDPFYKMQISKAS